MTHRFPDTACILACRDVDLGLLCTSLPGTVEPILRPVMHDATDGCDDAIVHRVIGSPIDWHTSGGTDWRDWLRARGVA